MIDDHEKLDRMDTLDWFFHFEEQHLEDLITENQMIGREIMEKTFQENIEFGTIQSPIIFIWPYRQYSVLENLEGHRARNGILRRVRITYLGGVSFHQGIPEAIIFLQKNGPIRHGIQFQHVMKGGDSCQAEVGMGVFHLIT